MAKRRPRGEGCVRKRKDGRWEGRIIIGHKKDGSPIYKTVTSKTQREVLQKLRVSIETYQNIDLTEDSDMTLSQWMDQWIITYAKPNLRPTTTSTYEKMIERDIGPALGNILVRSLTTVQVQEFYNALACRGRKDPRNFSATVSPGTVRSVHSLLHEIMDAAVRMNLCPRNPTNGTTVPKPAPPEMQVLSTRQMKKFMNAIKKDEQWYPLFYTEMTTGMRRGEICGLRWEDFDQETGRLMVRRAYSGGAVQEDTKTEAGKRTILLPESTADLLRKLYRKRKSPWIFPDYLNPECPIPPSRVYHKLKSILKENGLPDIRFHDLRHTFATHALESGVDPKTLSSILGHTKASFTLDRYTHVTKDMQVGASKIVGGFIDQLVEEVS